MDLKTLGVVHSPFIDKFGTPRQSQIAKHSLSELVLDKKIPVETLDGLQKGTYIWVLFGFHLNRQSKPLVKVHPPRLRGKKMGVLATRSPHRPNPIGLSLARIEAIHKNKISVSGLDVVHGTPFYDIKPYLPFYDRPRGKQVLWTKESPFAKLKVRFPAKCLTQIASVDRPLFKKQLREILCEDPRPLAYLEKTSHTYWLRYGKWDVGFQINNDQLNVTELKPAQQKKP
jgi:tRNA (adenine37-N6)-methyltransferase